MSNEPKLKKTCDYVNDILFTKIVAGIRNYYFTSHYQKISDQIASDQASEGMREQSAQMIEGQSAKTIEGHADGNGEKNKKTEINH